MTFLIASSPSSTQSHTRTQRVRITFSLKAWKLSASFMRWWGIPTAKMKNSNLRNNFSTAWSTFIAEDLLWSMKSSLPKNLRNQREILMTFLNSSANTSPKNRTSRNTTSSISSFEVWWIEFQKWWKTSQPKGHLSSIHTTILPVNIY